MKAKDLLDVPLNQKRCLTTAEFQIYMGVGRNNALKLIRKSGCVKCVGRKLLVDRKAFDTWLDSMSDKDLL